MSSTQIKGNLKKDQPPLLVHNHSVLPHEEECFHKDQTHL